MLILKSKMHYIIHIHTFIIIRILIHGELFISSICFSEINSNNIEYTYWCKTGSSFLQSHY